MPEDRLDKFVQDRCIFQMNFGAVVIYQVTQIWCESCEGWHGSTYASRGTLEIDLWEYKRLD